MGPGSWSRSGSGTPRPGVVRLGVVRPIGAEALVALLEGGLDRVVLIDSRPFVDYNASHILEAVNVNCSKLMKRRLQQDKVQIAELLQHSAKKKVNGARHLVATRGFTAGRFLQGQSRVTAQLWIKVRKQATFNLSKSLKEQFTQT